MIGRTLGSNHTLADDKKTFLSPVRTPIRGWIAMDYPGPRKTKGLDFSRPFAGFLVFLGPLLDGSLAEQEAAVSGACFHWRNAPLTWMS